MEQERTEYYTFHSEKELFCFFKNLLPRRIVRNTISLTEKKFVARNNTIDDITRLQILKKCEWELVRYLKKHVRSPKIFLKP